MRVARCEAHLAQIRTKRKSWKDGMDRMSPTWVLVCELVYCSHWLIRIRKSDNALPHCVHTTLECIEKLDNCLKHRMFYSDLYSCDVQTTEKSHRKRSSLSAVQLLLSYITDLPTFMHNASTYNMCVLSDKSIQYIMNVENKLNKFLRLIGTIKRTLINKVDGQTVLKFYKALAIPTLLYGSETSILTRAQQRRIEAAEMRLLKPLAGFRLQVHKRNEDIRQELNIENITVIEKYRNNWYDHITRVPNDRIPFRTWCYRPTRRRRVGRPKRRWRDQFDR
ncbi:hypothetical protein ANN_18531 [Periplaneta americana]|uniref:Uncharacterized protein n=1 Tax=Periplaneta americana TaxID=6978 RepID=A0ABQ8SP07_PERAM|nr:hypothetical protein ANN_18531 [Periplaneta americana]